MNKKQRVEHLKSAVFSEDWDEAKDACRRLFHFGGRFNKTGRRKCRRFLVELLDQENPWTRNVVAITFRINRFNAAVDPLFHAITKPENSRYNGTLVYALEKLNCGHHLGELFSILFGAAGNWEVQASALCILEEQIFEFIRDELRTIAEGWNAIQNDWNRLNNIDEGKIRETDFDRMLIQSFVDGYLAYL